VPTVAEVLGPDWPRNGLVAASLFAGCGGSSLGYRMAGYEVRFANEFVDHAADIYEANAPGGFRIDRRDVRELTSSEILGACGVAELDLLDGSPPCQPFSTAGTLQRGWGKERDYGDHSQRADDLVYEYARLVGEVRPRAFVMENVKGLVMGVAKGYFLRLMSDLRAHGYRVGASVLDAQWLGVPQSRQRVFIIGMREDLDLEPTFPEPLPYRYSMVDALPHLRGSTYEFDTKGHNQAPHSRSDPEQHPVHAIALSNGAAPWHHTLVTGRTGSYEGVGYARRPFDLEAPSPTVQATGASTTRIEVTGGDAPRGAEPGERRKLTIPEVAALCGFPEDFAVEGAYTEQWARFGNSVCPPVAAAVGRAVASQLMHPSSSSR
jgi:DNA (cytosine-5)-methyltransferase 1